METAATETKRRTTARGRLEVERRWVIRDIGWDDYQELDKLLPPTFRQAFDGSSLEIMVTGQLHDDYADALDTFFKAVAGALGVQFSPYRSASWNRPELERGIQADNCYYVTAAKIKAGLIGRARKSNDAKDYPNPDLAIEVDLSPPKVDREGIYAALQVAELWTFDGTNLTISRLDENGRYRAVEKSGFLAVRTSEVTRWILEEDRSDYEAWTQRIRAWAKKTLKVKGRGRSQR
jgi:Uma2 family endonuclease